MAAVKIRNYIGPFNRSLNETRDSAPLSCETAAGGPPAGQKKEKNVMLINAKTLEHCELRARDGDVGKVKDLYFDDERWHVRYLVVDTGTWLSGRTVLIASAAMTSTDWNQRVVGVNQTKEEVRNSPSVDAFRPVSRQQEAELHNYYGWPHYWASYEVGAGYVAPVPPTPAPGGTAVRAGSAPGAQRAENGAAADVRRASESEAESHLRSVNAVRGYHIEASDGSIGHVEDFLVDDGSWVVRYIIVDTRNWWPGRKVLVSPAEIRQVDWASSSVRVDLTREAIKAGPEFDPGRPVSADYIDRLEAHYGRLRGPAKPESTPSRRS